MIYDSDNYIDGRSWVIYDVAYLIYFKNFSIKIIC